MPPRPGRIPKIPAHRIAAVVEATLHTTPSNAAHWSTRSMAEAQCLNESTIRRRWKLHNLKPHLIKTFKLSRIKQFVEKLHDIAGLYLNPPVKALVLCVDKKPDTSSRPNSIRITYKEGPLQYSDIRLQAQWNDHAVCCSQRKGVNVGSGFRLCI
jgi:hypothetical protein